MSEYGALLRKFREKSGKSMGDVARHLGFSVTYVSDVERGLRGPCTFEVTERLTHFLDAPPGLLMYVRAKHHGCAEAPLRGDDFDSVAVKLGRLWRQLAPDEIEAIDRVLESARRKGAE